MRIAYLITRMDNTGGAQNHVRDLCLWLKENGHDPIVVTGARSPICQTLFEAGVRVVEARALAGPLRPLKDARAVLQISRILKTCAPDLLSCHSSKAGILGRIVAKAIGIPVIFTAHGWTFAQGASGLSRFAGKLIERACGPLSDHIITVSHYDRRLALSARTAPPDRITTIHSGMPLLPLVPRAAPAGPLVRLGMVARFGAPKDHETLLRALARLREKHWRLHLVGGGDASHVASMASELEVLDRIDFMGDCANVPAILAELDIFCLIQRREGFPRSILDAMRASLPIVASDVAGVRESIEDAVNGYLVPVGDNVLVAKSLGDLIDSPGLRVAMGNRGRARFENKFTLEHMLRPTLGIYRNAISNAAGRRGMAKARRMSW
jgi:glycosyltransferase involved in cell wall biosynthesis